MYIIKNFLMIKPNYELVTYDLLIVCHDNQNNTI